MKRYFLVFYKGCDPMGKSNFEGMMPVVQHDGRYINRKIISAELLKQHPIAGDTRRIMLTNIIELSESNFNDFTHE